MLNMKMILPVALVFGIVACEPIPVGPPDGGRPYPQQPGPYGNQQQQGSYGNQQQGQYGNQDYREPGQQQPGYDNQAPPPPTRDSYPTAERTDNPNRVISPYAPYNVIDVEGFRSGQLAKDPSNQKIFRIP